MSGSKHMILNALRVEQREDIPIYVFGIQGRLISHIAAVSRARRDHDGDLKGYQRPAVANHIKEILHYLSSPNPLMPNAIVLALHSSVSFQVLPGVQLSEWGSFGKLSIPLPKTLAEERPAWIVDGQQRVAALAQLDPRKHFPVIVVGFKAHSEAMQREQFVRVNKTKPLPRDLLNEILPEFDTTISKDLEKRQLAAKVLKLVRYSKDSPFYGRIRGLGHEKDEKANISQAAILTVIQNSIKARGVLFNYTDGLKNKHDFKGMATVIITYFEGARRVWPKAWEGNPKNSRLVHGVGIVALGALMDRVMAEVEVESTKAAAMVANRLGRIESRCAWTKGRWPILGCSWNELQNTSQDKSRLTEYLLKAYRG